MKTVLIVDDSKFIRFKLKTIIEDSGFQVVGEAENGLKAVQRYWDLRPNIITLDITMPEMDGLQALKHIRAMDRYVKIVMVSAMGQEHMVLDAIKAGANGFILKPFQENKVIETLNTLTEQE